MHCVGAELLPARCGNKNRQRICFRRAGGEDMGNGNGRFAQMVGEDTQCAGCIGFLELVLQFVRQRTRLNR